jgi:Zn-dependent M28 family amino/carboxypeptidase
MKRARPTVVLLAAALLAPVVGVAGAAWADLEPRTALIRPADLLPHLKALVGVRHQEADPAAVARAADYIERQLKAAGYAVRRQPFGTGLTAGVNVIGRLEGSEPSRKVVVVGAHYDTTENTPGADDNTSGVAALLEVARQLAALPRRHAVEVVAFALEEQGFLGSSVYVRDVRPRATLLAALVLESVGYTCSSPGCQRLPPGFSAAQLLPGTPAPAPDTVTGEFLAVVASPASAMLAEAARKVSYQVRLPVMPLVLADKGARMPAARLSDHVPFWEADQPALLLTGTAFLRNPGYHRPTDKLDTLDLPFLSRVATLTARLALHVAREP